MSSDNCPGCQRANRTGSDTPCPMCLLAGDIPKYIVNEVLEIGEEIGSGGMSTVFRALHLPLLRDVAVKFLAPELAEQTDFQVRFEREAHALAKLNHPNIVTIHDCGQEDGQPYIVMEYVEGCALSSLLPLPAEDTISIASQVCSALAYAHSKGIVHRDIKPDNILVSRDGQVKVADFGIAGLLSDETAPLTKGNQVLGTPYFMAPEATRGHPATPSMDIYSMGVVLYQSVMGQLPLGNFEPIPGPLEHVVRKALSTQPSQRQNSALALQSELDDLSSKPNSPQQVAPSADATEVSGKGTWLRIVALVHSAAMALVLWTILVSISPKEVHITELQGITLSTVVTASDGRTISYARFEPLLSLAAIVSIAMAIAAWILFRQRFPAGESASESSEMATKWVWRGAVMAGLLFAISLLGAHYRQTWMGSYISLLGGILELFVFYWFCLGILIAKEANRSVVERPILWLGLALALLPPAIEFLQYSSSFF